MTALMGIADVNTQHNFYQFIKGNQKKLMQTFVYRDTGFFLECFRKFLLRVQVYLECSLPQLCLSSL